MLRKKAIVNLVTHEGYAKGQARLIESLKKYNPEIDVFTYTSESEVGAPLHAVNPYAFKLFAIAKVRAMGYQQIVWLDASVYAVKDITPVFDWIDECGIFLEDSGHFVGYWCNKETLEFAKIHLEYAKKIPMFSAGFCGFDFNDRTTNDFFNDWAGFMLAGKFIGSWDDHRHDMTCGSIAAHINGLSCSFSEIGNLFANVGEGYPAPKESAVFYLQGI